MAGSGNMGKEVLNKVIGTGQDMMKNLGKTVLRLILTNPVTYGIIGLFLIIIIVSGGAGGGGGSESEGSSDDPDGGSSLSPETNYSTEGITPAGYNYVVKTDAPNAAPVITDIDQLITAFSGGYRTNHKLIENAQAFLDMQDRYKVNAIFAAAVSVIETTAGTQGYATSIHNWFNYQLAGNMEDLPGYGGGLRVDHDDGTYHVWVIWEDAISEEGESLSADYNCIIGFGTYIADHSSLYYSKGHYTVLEIVNDGYCSPPGDWGRDVLSTMKDMYNAAGIEYVPQLVGVPIETKTETVKVGDVDVDVDTYTNKRNETFKLYKQNVGPWASQTYFTEIVKDAEGNPVKDDKGEIVTIKYSIGEWGCPTTACATVATGLGLDCTPSDFIGFYSSGVGVLEAKGLHANRTIIPNAEVQDLVDENHKNKIIGYLQEGHPVIFHTLGPDNKGKSGFTNSEHWMAIIDIDETGENVCVAAGAAEAESAWYNIDAALVSLKDYVEVYK